MDFAPLADLDLLAGQWIAALARRHDAEGELTGTADTDLAAGGDFLLDALVGADGTYGDSPR